jgi:hypothetical protein
MTQTSESSHAIDSVAGRSAIERGTRTVRRLLVATASCFAIGLIAPPLAGLAWTAAVAVSVVAYVRLTRLRRLRRALTEHPWRYLNLTRVGASPWWESIENGSRQCYALPEKFPERALVSVSGFDRPTRRPRQWSAIQAEGFDDVKIVRGPRRPESRVAWTLAPLPIFAGPQSVRRPAAMHDVPFAPCRLDPAGLTVLPPGDGSATTEPVVIMRAKRGATSCELWLNKGDRVGEVVREKSRLGLLDLDGRVIVESDQRFGVQFFDSASTFRLASGRRHTLSLEGHELRSMVLRKGCLLETGGGEIVVRAVQTSRSRRERTVAISINTTLSPIERAIVVLRVCTLLDLPALPAVSS